ncbi:putative AP-3 complex subunit delta [Aspergillus mulundensis]|uniref:AP-3 complex subunit delta n=1 Tax=Aspergillus mulundensis TaxID=1810919 RepID=A0A3D8T3U5_9EURO|nr:AP-3 complex subunit delta [Aspergillus mulundensis]RDW93225.1 AP-3 complex subunit delta [Aspergillus mulundensis]
MSRFEKSLYDLIKGLRNHKGSEEDYIQSSLRECKAEIRSQDMDKKATALLKLAYLEMFGYDMSWASFNVLEVMSSPKFLKKRVGYLGALQSFRPETEVLMLATNLLKKDIVCPNLQIISLPLITLPNIITPALAMSLLSDVLSRISHSNPSIRKKAVVCLYRLALVYPEALRLAWPKLKDRLMDDGEDSSVTTAVLNVVCELGWRRPHDFLPLAPRFFELLVEGGNNWMAIKIIKLFATLTPLEPRLVRKLIRPLINIIQSTTAMSLLYECINGIIQGGILEGEGALEDSHEIADICVSKLRGMVVTDSDPNLKYVALLAFSRIVVSHPHLVSMHQDVIMNCLEDADISIRLQALELATRMAAKDTLQPVVERLIGQLEDAQRHTITGSGSDAEDAEGAAESADYVEGKELRNNKAYVLVPDDYRIEILHRVLDICSYDNYSRLIDFDWYVNILIRLVRHLPTNAGEKSVYQALESDSKDDAASRIGLEMRNIAVRVRNVRMEATRAAEFLLLTDNRPSVFANIPIVHNGLLGPLAWIVGEYAQYLSFPGQTLQSLIDVSTMFLPGSALTLFVQAVPKVLARIINDNEKAWSLAQRSEVSLFLARIVEFLEALAAHPDLEVQERAIEFLEIMRLSADVMHTGTQQTQMPYLLSSVIPGLFSGLELNPVAPNAQKKVPLPDQLRLNIPFNGNVRRLFDDDHDGNYAQYNDFYYVRETQLPTKPRSGLSMVGVQPNLYYQGPNAYEAATTSLRPKVDWKQRNKEDPFYIGADEQNGVAAPVEDRAPRTVNNEVLDVDSIPIVDLKIGRVEGPSTPATASYDARGKSVGQPKKYEVIPDEIIGLEATAGFDSPDEPAKVKRSLLQVDSSGLKDFTLAEDELTSMGEVIGKAEDDVEMATAMRKIEKIRLEMQRASERVELEGSPSDGTLVKKRKKPKKSSHGRARGVDSFQKKDSHTEPGNNSSSVQKKARKRREGPPKE